MDPSTSSFDCLEGCLTESAVHLYREALRNGSVEQRVLSVESLRAARILLQCGLLHSDPDDADRLRPNSPSLVASTLAASLHRDIRQKFALAAQAYDALSILCSIYSDNVRPGGVPLSLEYLQSVGEVRTALRNAAITCKEEIISLHPAGSASLAKMEEYDLEIIACGTQVKSLFPHSARSHSGVATHAAQLMRAGGEVRTMARIAGRMVSFGLDCVFFSTNFDGQDFDSAVVVREPAVVAHLLATVQEKWKDGVVFDPNSYRKGLDDSISDIQRAVLQNLASGAKDEAAARDLGMSVRTFRRHLAAVMCTLGAASRFQAAVLASETGLLGSMVNTA